jgi:cytochrome P450
MNGRRSTKDTTLPRGGGKGGLSPIFIPKDTEVNYLVYVTHRNPEFWGIDSEQFIPERWENRKYGFDYLPFNAGPRACLGQQFALTEAGYVAVRLLQSFDKFEALEQIGTEVAWNLTLTGRPRDGVKLRLHAASEQ